MYLGAAEKKPSSGGSRINTVASAQGSSQAKPKPQAPSQSNSNVVVNTSSQKPKTWQGYFYQSLEQVQKGVNFDPKGEMIRVAGLVIPAKWASHAEFQGLLANLPRALGELSNQIQSGPNLIVHWDLLEMLFPVLIMSYPHLQKGDIDYLPTAIDRTLKNIISNANVNSNANANMNANANVNSWTNHNQNVNFVPINNAHNANSNVNQNNANANANANAVIPFYQRPVVIGGTVGSLALIGLTIYLLRR